MNGVNLNAFQFNYDLTWMAFFQDAEGRTYARYGGREDDHADSQLTKASLLATMRRVLTLHETHAVQPESKYEPRAGDVFTPEQIPTMRKMMAPRKEKCIHCHDVGNAYLKHLGELGTLTKDMVFKYPSPKQLGIHIDSDDQTRVKSVEPRSAAAEAGLKLGDRIEAVDNHRVITFGDFTRVLELTPETGTLQVRFRRGGEPRTVSVRLEPGWRKRSADPSWRPAVNVVGPNSGFWARQLGPGDRKRMGIATDAMGLKVVVVWGAWARQAGIRNGDVVVGIDGQSDNKTIRGLQSHLQMNRNYGDTVTVEIVRGGQRKQLRMTLPDSSD